MREDRNYESKDDRIYRAIHAMYKEGRSIDEICQRMRSLPRWKTINYIQIIEGRERAFKERKGERAY